jgi:hypothetical protein
MIGTIINENVAANFISGPIGANGSKGIRRIIPIMQHNIPAIGPNIRKHATHMIDTGSKKAIPSGVLGKIGTRKTDTTRERALKIAAPANCIVNWVLFGIKVSFSSELDIFNFST